MKGRHSSLVAAVLSAVVANMPTAASGAYGPPTIPTSGSQGVVLAAERSGRTLYVSERGGGPSARCDELCAERWPPFEVSPLDFPTDGLGVVHRADGTRQWALGDRPLHFFADDRRQGDAGGDGEVGWRALRPADLLGERAMIERVERSITFE